MNVDDKTWKLYYRVAFAMAVVASAFSIMVGAMMISSRLSVKSSSPLSMVEIDQLRALLKDSPADEALKSKIRELDLVSRRFYFSGLTSLRTGGLLLFGGIVVAVISLKVVAVLRRRLPDPRDYVPGPDELEFAGTARWVIGGVAVAVITAAVTLGVTTPRGNPPNVKEPDSAGVQQSDSPGAVVVSIKPAAAISVEEFKTNWPGFRGPTRYGTAPYTNLPLTWDAKTGEGIIWKVKVPLRGMSSPVVWGNRVFLTGANDTKREVYCFDTANGTILWKMDVDAAPGSGKKAPEVNQDTGFAAPTPVVDGRIVYSVFANGDVAAFDFCAQKMWFVDLGLPANMYGYSASPLLYNGKMILQFDNDGEHGKTSQLIALDAATGKKVWSVERPVTESWPSPVLINTEKGPQVVTMANEFIVSHDAESGKEIWRVKCGGSEVAPSPIFAGGLVIAAETADLIYAVRPDGQGDVTKTHVVWRSEDGVSDVSSPVSTGELLFFAHSGGTITCIDVKTGKIVWDKSLDAEFYASPGLSGDRVYQVARDGKVFIFKADRTYEELGKADLGEPSDCSPAFVDGRIFMRGATNLFCIGNK